MSTALSSAGPDRLLIVRLGSMGDIIHSQHAVAALRSAMPRAVIGWLIEERWAELLCTLPTPRSGPRSPQRPLVDKIHTVDTKAWRKSLLSTQTWERIAATLSELRSVHYHTALDLQGAFRSALLARWSGATVIIGSAQPRENIASMLYSHQVIVRGAHVVEHELSIAEAFVRQTLAAPIINFPCDEAAERKCDASLERRAARNFILMNPGAGWGAKQWPAERYGQVAAALAQTGMKILVNVGPGEGSLANEVERASAGAAESVSCSITELIALTRRAKLFIGGDTGPMHLAAALKVPVVAIFGPTDPARNGPFGTRSIVLRNSGSLTDHHRRAEPDPGLLEITVEQVIDAASQLLRDGRG